MKTKLVQTVLTALAIILPQFAVAAPVIIDFDTFPDNSPVPNGTAITTQYLPFGVTFSSISGGPVAASFAGEASSLPNFLVGNPSSFDSITMDFTTTQPSVGMTLISVGEATVTATAFAADLTTVLDAVSISNPGTGVGFNNKNPITLNGASIARVMVAITQASPGDGYGIDDVAIVPEPTSFALLAFTTIAYVFSHRRLKRRSTA